MKTILKKPTVFTVITALCLSVFLAVSCEDRDQEAQVSNLIFTPCRQDSDHPSGKAEAAFTDKGVQITHYNFAVTCDFTAVNVNHTFVNGVLSITQQGSPNQADCVCYTDVSYTINGISKNEVNGIFINGVQVYSDNENNTLQGTKWKLIGIADVQTGDLTELEPKDYKKCYTLTFDTDSTFSTFSSVNELGGGYIADYTTHRFQISYFGGTKIGEIGHGELYTSPFWKRTIQSFIVKDAYPRVLHLYYNDNENYLKYREIGDIEPISLVGEWECIKLAYIADDETILDVAVLSKGYIVIPNMEDQWKLVHTNEIFYDHLLSGNSLTLTMRGSTFVMPPQEELDICEALENTVSFAVKNNELMIYFTGVENKNVLILKKR